MTTIIQYSPFPLLLAGFIALGIAGCGILPAAAGFGMFYDEESFFGKAVSVIVTLSGVGFCCLPMFLIA